MKKVTSPELQVEPFSVCDRVLPVVAILLLTWACALEFIIPASHDELHFSHAAWLWSQGKEPYRDFLYHNTPGIIYLLGAARLVLGDFGPEILWWGRVLCAVSLVTVAGFALAIGRMVHSRRAGWITVILFIPGTVIPYADALLFKHHFQIRPEVFALPWMTATVWLGFLAIQHPDRWATVRNGTLMSLLTAVAMFLSPRILFMAAGLGVALAVGLGRRIVPIVLGSLAGLVALVVLYGGLIGWENSWRWVYQYSSLLYGVNRLAALTTLRPNPAWPIIVFAPLAGLVAVIWSCDRATRCLAWMVLSMYSNVLIEGKVTSASWQGHIVVGSVLLASVGDKWFLRPSRALRVAVVLVGLAILGLPFTDEETLQLLPTGMFTAAAWSVHIVVGFALLASVGDKWFSRPSRALRVAVIIIGLMIISTPLSRFLRSHARVLTCWRCQLGGQVAAYQRVCAVTRGEPVMFQQKFHPIAVDDGTYLWTQRGHRELMATMGIPEQKLDLLQDVRERLPVIIEPTELHGVARNNADHQWIDHFVAENYRETEHGFMVRKDSFDKVAPLLEEFGVRMHLSIIRKE
ncbi:MAG TPA: hypothetical protein VI542_08790 [Candidatus Tectomicrobia bacterium]